VTRRFHGVAAVDCVSLDVAPGEFFSLLGPSGCGKTTTLRLIAGFDAPDPDGGVVRMLGEDVTARRPYQRPIGMVFQSYALFPHLDVARNVAFGLEERRVPKGEVRDRVDRALGLVRLDPGMYAGRRPAELSGGQRQRVALARALVLEPPILLLDEPLAALDLQLRKEMQLELRELNRTLGITFILVTHDQEEALVMSDRIAVMSAGRVVQVGSPAEIYEHPRTAFVANFIGEANLFAGTVCVVESGVATVTQTDGSDWRVPMMSAAIGDAVLIAVRPEWHDLVPEGRALSPALNALPGAIREIIFLGETLHVLVTLRDGATVRVALRNAGVLSKALPWRTGEPVHVTWLPHDAQVLGP
jgi:spermidine/putrescine ABC transporter ATP-binding subunit